MLIIDTITTGLAFGVSVNCYLVRTDEGHFLIDSGMPNKRRFIEEELMRRDCLPGRLKLIIITHGDKDHCGNGAYLRREYGAKIAMHSDDSGMVQYGNMFWNRGRPNRLVRLVLGRLLGLRRSDRFEPDLWVGDGYDLSQHGFDGKIIHLPGHSRGSIGVLTRDGDLFCGDLLANTNKPAIGTIVDDPIAAEASVRKLRGMGIRTVYPGHGKPFLMKALTGDLR
jgi:glyoxylase-like metal-dependent hydrolase (beta-lactamase superfamily II)